MHDPWWYLDTLRRILSRHIQNVLDSLYRRTDGVTVCVVVWADTRVIGQAVFGHTGWQN